MYRRAFPACEVDGPVDPVPFSHMLSTGAIPRKCASCRFFFEGECTRAADQGLALLALDHGPCPVLGDTTPTPVDTGLPLGTVSIPAKCRTCEHLEASPVRGFTCRFERDRWGALPRALDWGTWTPELPNLGLASGRPVSLPLLRAVAAGNEAEAVRAFRADFPEATFAEARGAFAELAERLQRPI